MPDRYPLSWPEGRARCRYRTRARFKTGWGEAVQFLADELRRLGGEKLADSAILSTNVPLRLNGQPRGTAALGVPDTGVAIYFAYKGRDTCFACDRWDRVVDNIYAVGKTIEALRGIARWGTGEMLDATFRGFAALPPSGASRPWRQVLGAHIGSLADAEIAYREKAHVCHPDKGGTADAMAVLNVAMASARKELSR